MDSWLLLTALNVLQLFHYVSCGSVTTGSAQRWLIGPSEQCDLAACYWPAIFSLRRCSQQLLACSNDASGCAQRPWTTRGPAGSVDSSSTMHWRSNIQPSFMILVPSNGGGGHLVPTLPDGARFEATIARLSSSFLPFLSGVILAIFIKNRRYDM
jgi:hypothetical protein